MRTLLAIFASIALAVTPCLAEQSPLPAGKPAGVKRAALSVDPVVFWMGVALLIGGGLALSQVKSSTGTTGTGS
ncbi:MAG: hypothetical protein JO256_01580 [Alphaproteobacteria bacterium]|nr:hypothetical protein [Alphaproteobacteria bacterium]